MLKNITSTVANAQSMSIYFMIFLKVLVWGYKYQLFFSKELFKLCKSITLSKNYRYPNLR
jgi:hypothetical protein